MKQDPLFTLAYQAMQLAYSPYSNFPVGAAIRTAQGQLFSGCNVENAAYPEGNCAETSAIAAMVSAGERLISDIYIIAQGEHLVTPCGGCRQRIREFSNTATRIHLCSLTGVEQILTLAELLPYSFGPNHL